MKNRPTRIARKLFQKGRLLLMLLPLMFFFGGTANAQSMKVQLLNGRTGKPISKGRRIWVYFNNSAGRQILDLHTDSQGVIEFETRGAKTFQVSPVGYIPCGEQPVGAPARDYPIDEILENGLLTKDDCGHLNAEPLRGRLLYFVKPASGWELFKN